MHFCYMHWYILQKYQWIAQSSQNSIRHDWCDLVLYRRMRTDLFASWCSPWFYVRLLLERWHPTEWSWCSASQAHCSVCRVCSTADNLPVGTWKGYPDRNNSKCVRSQVRIWTLTAAKINIRFSKLSKSNGIAFTFHNKLVYSKECHWELSKWCFYSHQLKSIFMPLYYKDVNKHLIIFSQVSTLNYPI